MSELEIPPPGWDRNELIALRVFGGPKAHPEWYWWGESAPGPDTKPLAYTGPGFSVDDAAALDVLKAMEAKGYGWMMRRSRAAKTYTCHFYDNVRGSHPDVTADTLADAITAAALHALRAGQ